MNYHEVSEGESTIIATLTTLFSDSEYMYTSDGEKKGRDVNNSYFEGKRCRGKERKCIPKLHLLSWRKGM